MWEVVLALAVLESSAIAAVGTAIAVIFGALGVLLGKWYFPYKIKMRQIDLAEAERRIALGERREKNLKLIVQQLSESLEGTHLLLEECHYEHDDQQRINRIFYDVLERQHEAMVAAGLKPYTLPEMPKPRPRNNESLAKARHLIGEGRQALVMLDDTLNREEGGRNVPKN